MAKPEQVLIIEPQNELRFRGPFTGAPVTSYLKLTNPTNNKVYFKIKTTAPKRYCVRPNSGVIKPKEALQIAVCLQLHEFDPTEKNKHKFMVQTVIAPEGDNDDYPVDVWKDIDPDQLMDSKLKCVFENPVNTATPKTTAESSVTTSDVNSTGDKNKGIGDCVKSSPKSAGDTEEKLLKAAQEVMQLREEESSLRQENLVLREEILKWRNAAMSAGKETSLGSMSGLSASSSSPQFPPSTSLGSAGLSTSSSSPQLPPSMNLVIIIVMAIIGYLLGKLI